MDKLILVNPLAGNNEGASWLPALLDRVERAGLGGEVLVECTRKGAIPDQVGALAPGKSRIIVVGGDGTVSEVLDAVCRLGLPLPVGIVPLGTGNDLARSLGLYRGRRWSVEEVLAYLGTTQTHAVDLWSIQDHLTFSNYASIGLDATVVRDFCRIRRWIQAHPPLGRRGLYFAMYILVWGRRMGSRIPRGSRLSWVDAEGRSRSVDLGDARVLAITNTPYYAAGALINPEGLVGDGLMEITLFSHMRHYAELMAVRLPALAGKGIQGHWWRTRARSAEIRLPEPICVQADGEDLTDPLAAQRVLAIRRRGQVQVLVW